MHDVVFQKPRDVVYNRDDGRDRDLHANPAQSTQQLSLERPADRDVAVQRDQHRYPDGPHLGYIDERPRVHLHVDGDHAVVVVPYHREDRRQHEGASTCQQEDVVRDGHRLEEERRRVVLLLPLQNEERYRVPGQAEHAHRAEHADVYDERKQVAL